MVANLVLAGLPVKLEGWISQGTQKVSLLVGLKQVQTLLLSFYVTLMTLSQLNYTNGVQKRSFSKCGFSTCLAYKIKGKHVYSNIIVLFLQKITRGAS